MEPLKAKLNTPEGVKNQTGLNGFLPNGNFTFTDNFSTSQLDYRWVGVRGAREKFITTSADGLTITPFDTNIKAPRPTSTLFYRQQHLHFTATTTLHYAPRTEKDLAGIVCYQSEGFNYVFGITKKGEDNCLVLQRTSKGESATLASMTVDETNPIDLQVKAEGDKYTFSYSTNGKDFQAICEPVSGDILSTNVAGGFTGAMIGLYATTSNDAAAQ